MDSESPLYHISTQEITAWLEGMIAASGKSLDEIQQWDLLRLPHREETLPTANIRVEGEVVLAGSGKKRHFRNPQLVYENSRIPPTTLMPDDINYAAFLDRQMVAKLTVFDTLLRDAGIGGAIRGRGIATNDENKPFYISIPLDPKCRFGAHRAPTTLLKHVATILSLPDTLKEFVDKVNLRLERGRGWLDTETGRLEPTTLVTEFQFIEPPVRSRRR